MLQSDVLGRQQVSLEVEPPSRRPQDPLRNVHRDGMRCEVGRVSGEAAGGRGGAGDRAREKGYLRAEPHEVDGADEAAVA